MSNSLKKLESVLNTSPCISAGPSPVATVVACFRGRLGAGAVFAFLEPFTARFAFAFGAGRCSSSSDASSSSLRSELSSSLWSLALETPPDVRLDPQLLDLFLFDFLIVSHISQCPSPSWGSLRFGSNFSTCFLSLPVLLGSAISLDMAE